MSANPETAAPTGRKKIIPGKQRSDAALGHESQNTSSPEGAKEGGNLPVGWTLKTVGELAANEPNSITDGPFGSKLKTEHYTRSGPRVIRLTNIGDGEFVDAHAHISDDHFSTLKKHRVFSGDIVIAALGEKLPRACLIPETVGPAIVKADCIRFKPSEEHSRKFLNYAMNWEGTQKRTASIVHGVGRPRLNLSEIKSILLPIAPPDEQRRIVAEIEKQFTRLEAGVAGLRRVQANLKRYRAAVLKAACEGNLFSSLVNVTFKDLAVNEWGPAADLPDEWKWTTPREVCEKVIDCHNKTAPYSNFGIPLVRTTNIRTGKIDLADTRFVDQATYEYWSRRCYPEPGDVLFTREAPMGEAGLIPHGARLCMGQRMMLMRASNLILNSYLLITLQAPQLKTYIERTAVGSGVRHLGLRTWKIYQFHCLL
jgi:type I restriction enzyme S subunit